MVVRIGDSVQLGCSSRLCCGQSSLHAPLIFTASSKLCYVLSDTGRIDHNHLLLGVL